MSFYLFTLLPLSDFHDFLLKQVVVYQRPIFCSGLVCVDRMDRVVQKLRNAFAVVDAQANQGEDSHLGGQ